MAEIKNKDQKEQQAKPVVNVTKSTHAEREEKVLAFWKEKGIFEKTLNKTGSSATGRNKDNAGKEFVFYEGPPTANGRPGIHHLESRAFKDAIPRYKTMCGYHVTRKGGWDTHGLPVELQVEKELGLKAKKEIESYGIAKFNEKCKESVWTYIHDWERFTDRMGYWVDLVHPYITYKPAYIEALWGIMKKVNEQKLLYKDYKVVPWCPRCGTALSSHELAQGYADVKDLSVTVKFKVKAGQKIGNFVTDDKTFILAWTTTPWTLPGNVGLAVGKKIEYVGVRLEGSLDILILAKERLSVLKDQKYGIVNNYKGADLVGLSYEPLYLFIKENITGAEKEKMANAYKVYPADFVTTEDGTGIVHTAVMYGQDDFVLGTSVGLPKYHLVNEDGTFKKETGFLAGSFVKDPNVDVSIIKDLAGRAGGSLLFSKEKYEHSYPFCWRCKTPLIYFARDSWYIKMSVLCDQLVKENEGINWEPEHIKEGRFGEWLREIKDWAISRERYWGTPLPVWVCNKCNKIDVVGSVEEVSSKPKNTYYVVRHGEAENNVKNILSAKAEALHHLTPRGKEQVAKTADLLKDVKFDEVFISPFVRTRETADILKEKLGWKENIMKIDDRLHEMNTGSWDGKSVAEYSKTFPTKDRFTRCPEGGETYADIKKRTGSFLYELEAKYSGKTILIVTHETVACMLYASAKGLDRESAIAMRGDRDFLANAEVKKIDWLVMPHNTEYELDLHRPYIDEIKLPCSCGGEMSRVKEVVDVWFDSGAMPFAQNHELNYELRIENYESDKDSRDLVVVKEKVGKSDFKLGIIEKGGVDKNKDVRDVINYPADFISEAIDQTRGWFYTLHAISVLMGKGKAYKNVICLGHILDPQGKKMSKSIGNVVNPTEMMDKYGADALRLWMYSVNQPGDSKNFDEKTVDEINKKVFNLASNVLTFYQLYAGQDIKNDKTTTDASKLSKNVLDLWIIARMDQLTEIVTKGLDGYQFFEPVREIREFVGDLSQWYIRRSRDRFKGENESDKQSALATTRFVLINLAKVMAPFAPFFAEYLYQGAGGAKESVHLEDWPETEKIDQEILDGMTFVRAFATMALMQRNQAKINVRQPLSLLKIKHNGAAPARWDDLKLVLMDEVNVKDVIFDSSITGPVELIMTLTPALKEEGDLRELLRKIQDLRKEKGLSVNDMAVLIITQDMKDIISKNEKAIKSATKLSAIEFGEKFDVR